MAMRKEFTKLAVVTKGQDIFVDDHYVFHSSPGPGRRHIGKALTNSGKTGIVIMEVDDWVAAVEAEHRSRRVN
jgi:hypothetical protein